MTSKTTVIFILALCYGVVNHTPCAARTWIPKRPVDHQYDIHSASLLESLEALLQEQSNVWGEQILEFYQKNEHRPVWVIGNRLTRAAIVALDVLEHADAEGLNPQAYQTVHQLIQPLGVLEGDRDSLVVELTLTKTFLQFIHDVRVGRVPAENTAESVKLTSPKTTPVDLLYHALTDHDTSYPRLRQMAPPQKIYHVLKEKLASYRAMTAMPTVDPFSNDTLRKGDQSSHVRTLRTLLTYWGHTDVSAPPESEDYFDDLLETAVKRFQKHHTLEMDGVVGAQTKHALLMTPEHRIKKLTLNLERLRWFPDDMGDKHIIVNVAGFEVLAIQNDTIVHRIKAIVGRPSRKSLLFYAPLKNIVLNPSWGMPSSILIRDTLHKIRQDPGYILRNHYTVYDAQGQKIDPYQADWEFSGHTYRLRQSPGAHNALGRIKLNIENPYIIYLHGTPHDGLFQKSIRAFSSGCIRLEYPTLLTSWVLGDDWSEERIESLIEKGSTQTIPLEQTIPVYFSYQTAWVDEQDQLHLSGDIYGLDKSLEQSLKAVDALAV